MAPMHRPSRVWFHGRVSTGEITERQIGAVRHALDVALCWLHDHLASPPIRWSQQVQEKKDWKRWYQDADGAAPGQEGHDG